MRLGALSIASLTLVLCANAARAAEAATPIADEPPQKRAGVVLGAMGGVGVADSSGYPNDVNKIGEPGFHAASGAMFGGGPSFFAMIALSDWSTFGLWGGASSYASSGYRSNGGGGGFRLELFPFQPFYPDRFWSNVGVGGSFGIGSTQLHDANTGATVADGVQSFIGASVFYEWTFLKTEHTHFVLGPSLEYDVIESRPTERNGALVGARLAFYSGK